VPDFASLGAQGLTTEEIVVEVGKVRSALVHQINLFK